MEFDFDIASTVTTILIGVVCWYVKITRAEITDAKNKTDALEEKLTQVQIEYATKNELILMRNDLKEVFSQVMSRLENRFDRMESHLMKSSNNDKD